MNSSPIILDCTLRDGTYVASFSESEIGEITEKLSICGIKYIEVGHGLGMGYQRLKPELMKDADFIAAATKRVKNNAKLGTFFIPGVGNKDDITEAKKLGLDFIRIGTNASDHEKAIPFINHAKEQGLETYYNSMKSYTLSPLKFAKMATEVEKAGVDGVYLVDSAGGMFPDQVSEYIRVTRENVKCKIGFHGHNNLMLANANIISSIENGADLIDTTLLGLGRGGGNAPTEIVLYIVDKMGIKNKIDNKEILELSKKVNIAKNSKLDTSGFDLDIIGGFAMFHSGFTETFSRIAEHHRVDLRDLIIKVSEINNENPSDRLIAEIAEEIQNNNSKVFSPRSVK